MSIISHLVLILSRQLNQCYLMSCQESIMIIMLKSKFYSVYAECFLPLCNGPVASISLVDANWYLSYVFMPIYTSLCLNQRGFLPMDINAISWQLSNTVLHIQLTPSLHFFGFIKNRVTQTHIPEVIDSPTQVCKQLRQKTGCSPGSKMAQLNFYDLNDCWFLFLFPNY